MKVCVYFTCGNVVFTGLGQGGYLGAAAGKLGGGHLHFTPFVNYCDVKDFHACYTTSPDPRLCPY